MVDVGQSSRSPDSGGPARVRVSVRPLTLEDVPWLLDIGVRRYPNNYDPESTGRWIRNAVLPNTALYNAWRTNDAFLIALLSISPWLPNDIECHVVVTSADFGCIWQTIPLLRASIEWARSRKCVSWGFQSDTTHDIAPLMKRIGAKEISRYKIELGDADGK